MQNKPEPMILTASQFMQLLQISPNTFKKQLDSGALPPPLALEGRVRRWCRKTVLEFIGHV